MSHHLATVHWKRDRAQFIDNQYSREHTWHFDGGAEIAASVSPHNVREPYTNPACVDPEEAFVASDYRPPDRTQMQRQTAAERSSKYKYYCQTTSFCNTT